LAGALLRVRGEIMDRIDRLQETVELVRSDARVNWATADTAIIGDKDLDSAGTLKLSAGRKRHVLVRAR